MDASVTATLGLVFLGLAIFNVILMFKLWSYPYDERTKTSGAPRSWTLVHRGVGYGYGILYVVLMTQMVPRLFSYQVELPARTVAHLMLGVTIGVILVLKIVIVRFFRIFEEPYAPLFGMGLLLCTVLLISLSVPFTLKERQWRSKALSGDAYSAENLGRVRRLLPAAGFPAEAPLEALATVSRLRGGRTVLLSQCVECHDLKTILSRPRAPSDWVHTVDRMAEKPAIGRPIEPEEQWEVAAYLIAISPDLHASAKKKRELVMQERRAKDAVARAVAPAAAPVPTVGFDTAEIKALYERTCTQCHELSEVDQHPPKSGEEVGAMLSRMVDNGLDAPTADLERIAGFLRATYAP